MSKKHRAIYKEICKIPVPANIKWKDIESLLLYCGAEISEGNGSRVRIELNAVKAVFHRPHPRRETDRGAVVSMRRFLENARIKHDDL